MKYLAALVKSGSRFTVSVHTHNESHPDRAVLAIETDAIVIKAGNEFDPDLCARIIPWHAIESIGVTITEDKR